MEESTSAQRIGFYRTMLLIRRFEEKAAEMYAIGKIGGFCHLYIGEEAVAVGAISASLPEDYIVTTYREHGHILARGSDPKRVMAELFGKATGVSKGKGGSMHLFDVAKNFMGGYGIVGGHIPLAVGMAFAIKYRKTDQVVLCFFGEGSVPNGAFHESLNMASLWRLPVVFICENNRFGMGTPVERASALYDIAHAAKGYNMPFHHLDGMDVQSVHGNMIKVIDAVRTSKRPIFVEAQTYRFMGHSMADPAHGHYRSKDEIDEQKKRDPIHFLRQRLIEEKIFDEAKVQKIEKEIRGIIQGAIEFADKSPEPDPSTLYEDIEI